MLAMHVIMSVSHLYVCRVSANNYKAEVSLPVLANKLLQ